MHTIEKELIKATGYKPRQKFNDRQDYLGSILNAVIKLTDDDFENLSDEAATWANAAIEAKNAKDEELPDFDETPEEEADEADTEESEEEADEESTEEAESDPTEEPEGEGEAEVAEEDPEPAKKPSRRPPPAPKPAKKAASTAPKVKPPQFDEDVVLDKWGCMEGSKNSQALSLFEKGATAKEVKEKLGGTYYNILGKMVEKGHKMEKEGALIKLTHSDSSKKPPVKGKAKK